MIPAPIPNFTLLFTTCPLLLRSSLNRILSYPDEKGVQRVSTLLHVGIGNRQIPFMPAFTKSADHLCPARGRARIGNREGRSLVNIQKRAHASLPEDVNQRIQVRSNECDVFRFVIKSDSFNERR